jgi:hypothetical protein
MEIKNYFIWEKQQWHNKGISIKLTTSRYCYIKPTMCGVWENFDKKLSSSEEHNHYLICQEKTIFWLWFRLTFKVEVKTKY